MLALQITNLKNFMNHLLTADTFDIYLLEEATIKTACTYTIDGHVQREFYTAEEQEDQSLLPYDFAKWNEIKGLCFQLMKGKRTPLYFKFVLHLMPEYLKNLLTPASCDVAADDVKALILTVKFDGGRAILTTGSAYRTFIMSKEPDIIWDKALRRFLDKKEILYEEL